MPTRSHELGAIDEGSGGGGVVLALLQWPNRVCATVLRIDIFFERMTDKDRQMKIDRKTDE